MSYLSGLSSIYLIINNNKNSEKKSPFRKLFLTFCARTWKFWGDAMFKSFGLSRGENIFVVYKSLRRSVMTLHRLLTFFHMILAILLCNLTNLNRSQFIQISQFFNLFFLHLFHFVYIGQAFTFINCLIFNFFFYQHIIILFNHFLL